MGGVFALYTAVRCSTELVSRSHILPSLIAGAVAVTVPTVADAQRRQLLAKYYGSVLGLKTPAGVGFVIASSALSGSVVFGSTDLLLQYFGFKF